MVSFTKLKFLLPLGYSHHDRIKIQLITETVSSETEYPQKVSKEKKKNKKNVIKD